MAQTVWGLHFPNPVGLAAGMDKGQVLVPAWFRIGFGFVEIGTVTPRPQRGNPRPRLFRLVEHHAIVNRMGFNNPGAERVARRLARTGVEKHPRAVETGGLSGAPLRGAAERACARLYLRLGGRLPIIGVGGIGGPEDAYRRIRAGATLVQIYTALVYQGPGAVREIQDGLARLLERDGLTLGQAVGLDAQIYVERDRTPARAPSST